MNPFLFTAFEPSGDRLAAAVIRALKEQQPERPIVAFGGGLMAEAGAEILEDTCSRAVMGLDILPEVPNHLRRLKKLKKWLKSHPVDLLVPVDSPAANWSICAAVRKAQPQARIAHLVMPQVWAWASWRMHKLKRLSDHVLCLLPFEAALCQQHGIPATFVGHPTFDELRQPLPEADNLPSGTPKLAVLAGSRAKELQRNLPVFAGAVALLQGKHPDLAAVLCLRRDKDLPRARAALGGTLPDGLTPVIGQTQQAFQWCDLALVKSGTSTLEATARHVPHIMAFCAPRWQNTLVRPLIATDTFALPNLIAQSMNLCEGPVGGQGRIVPELCPYFGGPEPLAEALEALIAPTGARQAQLAAFEAIGKYFGEKDFAKTAAGVLNSI